MITKIKDFLSKKVKYNGILYFYDIDKAKKDRKYKYIHYWIYIYDNSDVFKENIKINSIDAIRTDSFVIGEKLEHKFDIEIPVSDTYFIVRDNIPNEFKNTKVYGGAYATDKNISEINDIFLNKLYGKYLTEYEKDTGFNVIDVKKVRINPDGTHYVYTKEEIELEESSNKYNL